MTCFWHLSSLAYPQVVLPAGFSDVPLPQELKIALSAGELIPYIQPVVSAEGGVWIGAEILMRWNH